MTGKERINWYQARLDKKQTELEGIKQIIRNISIARLSVFLIATGLIIYFANVNPNNIVYTSIALAIAFFKLIQLHNRYEGKKKYLEAYIQVQQNEIDALNRNYSAFEGGEEFLDDDYTFHHDLDLFGQNSIFQLINRTCTRMGKTKLAKEFLYPELRKNEILNAQNCINELEEIVEFRHQFLAKGMDVEEEKDVYKSLIDWMYEDDLFYHKKIYSVLRYVAPLMNLTTIVLAFMSVLPWSAPALSLLFSLGLVGNYTKKINRIHVIVSKKSKILSKYGRLIRELENQEFEYYGLKQLQQKLISKNTKAARVVEKLSSILNALDSRLNIFAGVLLNALAIWDIQQILRLEAWKHAHREKLADWFDVIGQFDAYISLANLGFNHPNWTQAEILEDQFKLTGKALKHPLMDENQCVANDVEFRSDGHFKLITGANMAGKSTYLRTVGVNMILASTGAKVCAESFSIFPLPIISSLRTKDSITSGESYFYAEIKRLQLIIDKLNKGEKLFVLLDEILKGTNSRDKEAGSFALLKQLIHLKAVGIIATHDLNLADEGKKLNLDIDYQRFEVDIVDQKLIFDYLLRDGVAENLSATFLMKQMGITL
jgi:DNA mismatch repair ATPase MutS